MTLIFMQRGATSWGFQAGRYWLYINYPRFWRTSGFWSRGKFPEEAYKHVERMKRGK